MKIPPINVSRRDFLRNNCALTLGALIPSSYAMNVLALNTSSGATSWGQGEVLVVSDGYLSLPAGFAVPEGSSEDEAHSLLKQHNQPTDRYTPDCNVTVWRSDEHVVLFDVGAGPNFMESTGRLLDSMDSAGVDPMEVTDVVFTHAHPDHLWGVLDDFDELICPLATYHMGAVEWDYWRAEDTMDKTPENRKSFVAGAQNRFPAIEQRLSLFKVGDEILPNLEAVDTNGHTPGHMAFAIHDKGENLFVVGDALTNVALSFARPDWPSASDQDPDQGRVTRKRLLDRLAHEKSLIIGFHLPHPGLGRVVTDGQSYKFVVA